MKLTNATLTILAIGIPLSTASAAVIAGSDFSNTTVFNAAGGTLDNLTDDLDLTDNITVSAWVGANTGSLQGTIDASAQVGMPNDIVTKINGDGQGQPAIGASPAGLASVSFTLTIPANTILDLTSVEWVSRQSTPTTSNVRWIAFDTSLDSGITFSQVGDHRNDFDTNSVNLSGATYQGLTNTTVTFNWYAGGTGTGDQDFDTVCINGTVTQVPEPSSMALLGLASLALIRRRR